MTAYDPAECKRLYELDKNPSSDFRSACGQLRALEAIVKRQSRWIAQHKLSYFADWACAQCVPHSDMLVKGFVCCYHEALALTGDSDAIAAKGGTK